jgi:hypothetical protein
VLLLPLFLPVMIPGWLPGIRAMCEISRYQLSLPLFVQDSRWTILPFHLPSIRQPDLGSSALPLAWVITETDVNTETFFLKIRYNFL